MRLGTVAFFAVFGGIFAIVYWNDPFRVDMRLCDKAIMGTLKAPSSYQKIDGPEFYFDKPERKYFITYEAQNSFGVAIQSKGTCSISGKGGGAAVQWDRINL